MMNDFTIIVRVATEEDQRAAFRFVENALAEYAEKNEDLAPDGIHVSTPDGTQSVEL